MSKGRDRPPRMHQEQTESSWLDRMDHDRYRPSPRAPPSASSYGSDNAIESVDAVVKWFNSSKGFGFVELTDGSGDVYLHVSAIEAAGLSDLAEGTPLRVQIGQGARGRQIIAIVEVLPVADGTQTLPRSPPSRPAGAGA